MASPGDRVTGRRRGALPPAGTTRPGRCEPGDRGHCLHRPEGEQGQLKRDLPARERRLAALVRDLVRDWVLEAHAVNEEPDLPHFTERELYKVALWEAIAGLEQARVTLAKPRQRIERGG